MLYTCLYNIFLNVEAVHRLVFSSSRLSLLRDSVFFLSWHLLGGLLSALVVSVLCSVAAKVASLLLPGQDKADDRMEECRRQCRVDFNWRPVGKNRR